MGIAYPASNALQRLTLRLFADWKVEGRKNVPPVGPLIVVANHLSNCDPSLLAVSLERRVWFLAKDTLFRGPVATWFLRSYGAFPLNREGSDIAAYRWALGQLHQSRALVLFPEGTRSRGALQKAGPGVVRLALKTQASLLPVGITGTERLGHVTRSLYPTGAIRVKIGQAFTLPSVQGKLNAQVQESLVETIMLRIAALLPESYRGVYRTAPGERAKAVDSR